ncbi:MAG: M48 family metalloprotease, partial [Acidimicrobiales bacterium]
ALAARAGAGRLRLRVAAPGPADSPEPAGAELGGIGAARRLLVAPADLRLPAPAFDALVAHELGHLRRRHTLRRLPAAALGALVLFGGLAAAGRSERLLAAAGAASLGDPKSLPAALGLGWALQALAGLGLARQARRHEREADAAAFALCGRADGLVELHRLIALRDLAELAPGRVSRLRAAHPPAPERIAAALALAAGANDQPRCGPAEPYAVDVGPPRRREG